MLKNPLTNRLVTRITQDPIWQHDPMRPPSRSQSTAIDQGS